MKPMFNDIEIFRVDPSCFEIMFAAFKFGSKKCEYCDEEVFPSTCGAFIFGKKRDEPVVICKSVLCMSEYIDEMEERTIKR